MAVRSKSGVSLLDKAGLDALLPDEEPQEFKDFRDDLLEELKPQTRYQHSLAMNLVMIEWEISRHRRMVASFVRDQFRRHAAGVRGNGAAGKSTPGFSYSGDVKDGTALLAGDRNTLSMIASKGVTKSEITAVAMSDKLDHIVYHEGRVSDLERRRRSLRDDYDRLQSKRPPSEDVEDAVEVT
jgi:hypothetical protein